MTRAALPVLVLWATLIGGCSSSRLASDAPAKGGLASAPLVPPAKIEYPAGGEGVIADAGSVIISGQPTEASLRHLVKEKGITLVINLRTPKEMDDRAVVPFDEAAVLKELGVDYVNVPLGRPDHPASPDKVDQVAAALAAHQGRALLHCTVAGRASHMWAAYLIRHRGVKPEVAVAEAASIQPNRPMYADLVGADVEIVPSSR
jgi:uncharacterized protein (TIGR01244 family)